MDQYNSMTQCISNEKNRIKQKEIELREKVLNVIEKVEVPEQTQTIPKKEEEIVM